MKAGSALLPVLLLTALLPACGEPAAGAEIPLAFDLRLSRFTGDETLQLVIVETTDRSGGAVSCEALTQTCLADQTRRIRIVTLEESGGSCAWQVPLDLEAARSAEGQAIAIEGVPPGRGYFVVAEILRGSERVGAGCLRVAEVQSGLNPPPPSPIQVLEGGGGCNPSLTDRCSP